MQAIHGRDVILELFITDQWYPVLCATDVTFRDELEVIYKTGPNSGLNREKATRLSEAFATVTGLSKMTNADGQIGFHYMFQEAVRRSVQQIRITFLDEDGNNNQLSGDAIIPVVEFSSSATDFMNATIEFAFTGAIEIEDLVQPPEPDESCDEPFPLYIEGAEGAYSVSHADLDGVEILLVMRESGPAVEITSGTPIDREFIYTDGSGIGTITFASGMTFNAGEIVYIQYKNT